jgi:hypothetical protein
MSSVFVSDNGGAQQQKSNEPSRPKRPRSSLAVSLYHLMNIMNGANDTDIFLFSTLNVVHTLQEKKGNTQQRKTKKQSINIDYYFTIGEV